MYTVYAFLTNQLEIQFICAGIPMIPKSRAQASGSGAGLLVLACSGVQDRHRIAWQKARHLLNLAMVPLPSRQTYPAVGFFGVIYII